MSCDTQTAFRCCCFGATVEGHFLDEEADFGLTACLWSRSITVCWNVVSSEALDRCNCSRCHACYVHCSVLCGTLVSGEARFRACKQCFGFPTDRCNPKMSGFTHVNDMRCDRFAEMVPSCYQACRPEPMEDSQLLLGSSKSRHACLSVCLFVLFHPPASRIAEACQREVDQTGIHGVVLLGQVSER